MSVKHFFNASATRGLFKALAGTAIILGAVGYLAYRLSSIETRVEQAVDVDIPGMQETLKDSSLKTDKITTDVDTIARRINEELMGKIEQLGRESTQSAEKTKELSEKIDTLASQYVRFLKLAEDKITVSVPPRWVDELPRRDGTIFSMGISTHDRQAHQGPAIGGRAGDRVHVQDAGAKDLYCGWLYHQVRRQKTARQL